MAINSAANIHKLVMCSNVFVRKDGKYLMLRRSPQKTFAPNYVHPIGGKIDPDENPLEAAIREVREEAGIEIKNLRLEAVINELKPHLPVSDENWLIFHFSADYDSGEVKKTEEGDLVLLTAEEVKASDLFPSVRHVIDEILDKGKGTVFTTTSAIPNSSEKTLEKKYVAIV